MGRIITMFLQVFGKLLLLIYNFCHSYALALVLFTLLTKILLFYFSYQGKKSMMQTTAMQGELEKLKKQYGKDQARLNEETQKLYEREGVNPLGGCVWMMVPMFILMGLYYIIRRPMLYMMALTDTEIKAAIEAVEKLGYSLGNSVAYKEMTLTGLMNSDTTVWNAVAQAVGSSSGKLAHIDFHWLGLDLAKIPTWKFWTRPLTWENIGLTLIPVVVVIVSLLYSQLSQKTNQINMGKDGQNDAAAQSTKTMMIMMPLMYLWFGYIMPAGMCVYMIFNSLFMAIQEVICAWMLRGKFAELQAATERRAQEAKEEERRHKEEIARRRAEEAERMKTKKGRQQAKQQRKAAKGGDRPTEHSRVGVRAYARGRAYDPNRYPVTPYWDPQDVLDEAALEETLSRKGILPRQETAPAPVTDTAPETTPEANSSEDMFREIDNEINGGDAE